MSVQLILYPQDYSPISFPVFYEYLADGINFNGIDSAASTTVTAPEALNAANHYKSNSVLSPNTWAKFGEAATTVSETSGVLAFSGGTCGVIQKIQNLIPSFTYYVTIEFGASTVSSVIHIENFSYLSAFFPPVSGSTDSATVVANTTVTLQFTANATSNMLAIYQVGVLSTINSISVTSQIPQPSGATNVLGNGQVICDLYEDEDIPLTLSVDNFTKVAEKVQSYSKDFNLPATKRNNQIFDNIFEITRSTQGFAFNPYVKTQCVLKQDGYTLFSGYLRLIDISTDSVGEISYNVNVYSETIALADVLKDKTFNNMSFEELQHTYNITEIKLSWNTSGSGITYSNPNVSGFRDTNSTLKYPFIDWTGNVQLSTSTNYPLVNKITDAFRPCINVKYLVDRIFQDTQQFTYTSNFFDTNLFKEMYMDFNWGEEGESIVDGMFIADDANTGVTYSTTAQVIDFDGLSNGSLTGSDYYNLTNNRITPLVNGTTIKYNFDLYSSTSVSGIETNVLEVYVNGTLRKTQNHMRSGLLSNSIASVSGMVGTGIGTDTTLTTSDYVEFKLSKGVAGNTDFVLHGTFADVRLNIQSSLIDVEQQLLNFRGELGQWEFLQGLFTMFNLVSLPDPDNPNNLLIEPYEDVFNVNTAGTNLAARGIQHDWTDKVDVAEMKLMPLTDLNKETIFKFVEDEDDYVFGLYKKSTNGFLYGSKEFNAEAYTILEGKDEIIAEPFAATVAKPLFEQFGDFVTPAVFTSNGESTQTESFENLPRIFRSNGAKTLDSSAYYTVATYGGVAQSNETLFLQFTHLTSVPTTSNTFDYNFGECQLVFPIGAAPVNNLFSWFWQPYYAELYNPDTRIMTIKVNLTPADINTFKFNDRVFIKNQVFRVNKIDYKPNALATVEFIKI